MQTLMLDSNVFDVLVETDERLDRVRDLVRTHKLDLVATHVQLDEIAETPDPAKRERLQGLPVRNVLTMGLVLGVSRWGLARFGPAEPIEAIRRGNRDNTEDALIAATAHAEGCVLVTNDNSLAKRATELGVDVWRPNDLLRHIDCL